MGVTVIIYDFSTPADKASGKETFKVEFYTPTERMILPARMMELPTGIPGGALR